MSLIKTAGFTRGGNIIANTTTPLSEEQIRGVAPAVFATTKHDRRSDRYTHVPTIDVLNALREEGFVPFAAAQTRVKKDASRIPFTKHLLRLRHQDGGNLHDEANEIILVNSHDGTSAYQMMSGILRFVCMNGMIVGSNLTKVSVPHKGDVIGSVIEGAYTVVKNFEQVDAIKDSLKAMTVAEDLQFEYAKAALALKYPMINKGIPAPIDPIDLLGTRRTEDSGDNMWAVFNRVQENLVRGGLEGRNANGRRVRTRGVANIDNNLRMNRQLWALTESVLVNGQVVEVEDADILELV